MSQKVFNLIDKLTTGFEIIGEGLVAYFAPACAVPLAAAIPLIGSCIINVCKLFVKE